MCFLSLVSLSLTCTTRPVLSYHCFSLGWCGVCVLLRHDISIVRPIKLASKEGWGAMRGAGVFWGLPTNRYHGELLLSKPPRSQLLTCSVMGRLNSKLYMDMRISLSFFASLFLSFCFLFLSSSLFLSLSSPVFPSLFVLPHFLHLAFLSFFHI